jgi:predicted porin
VSDQSSRIIFGVAEDLGGGLKAIGQYDMRFNLDAASRQQVESVASPTPNFTAGGNSHIGLSGGFGAVRMGRQDIYYVDQPSLLPAGLYLAANTQPVFHALANANASRTPNLLWWVSPRMSGFEATVAYSTNPLRTSGTVEVENDMSTVAQRKGSGTVLRLNYTEGPIDATLSTMDYKSDYMAGTGGTVSTGTTQFTTGSAGGTANGNADQKGTTLVLKYQVNNALRVAVGMSDEKTILTAAVASATDNYSGYTPVQAVGGTKAARATSFSASYDMGAWNFAMHQAARGNYKFDGVEAAQTGASITSLAATYNFSKRTAAGLMWTSLKNDAKNATGLFYQGNNAYGGQVANLTGETHNMTSLAVRHNF